MAEPERRPALKHQAVEPAASVEGVEHVIVEQFLLDERLHVGKRGISLHLDRGQMPERILAAHDAPAPVSRYSCISSRSTRCRLRPTRRRSRSAAGAVASGNG